MAKDSLPREERLAIVRSFLEEAYDDGLISSALRDTLVAQARRRYIPVPLPDLVSSQAAATTTEHPQPATRVTPTPPVHVPPPDRRPTQPTAKTPVPVQTPATTVHTPAPSKPVPTPPRPATPARTGPTFGERMGKRARLAWSRLSADFAANSLIYLGVLISVVVIFVFFAFGYFGEAVETPSLRSPIFVAVPLLFFALAWILRTKTGVRAAADAVGLIGALVLPIMLSAVFQDGANWSNRKGIGGWFPLSWVPNYEGSQRWIGYAIVGLVCAGIYFLMATRHSIYAYGVAPMLWAAAGALGLYWSDGMSGPQMLIVLAAIVVGLVAASLGRATHVGRTVSVATIRIGVVGAPIVFVFALLFAYNDAIEDGIASPDLADLAYPGALAAGLLAAVLAISSGTAFAWSGLGERTRDAAATVMRVAAYLAAGVALVLALAYETTPGWIGAVLVGYGLAVAVVDHIVGGTGPAPQWIARGAIVVGTALTFVDPAATIVVWSVIAVVACLRATVAPVRSATNAMLPYPTDEVLTSLELWVPAFVLVGAGIVRWVAWIDVPTVLMTAAVVAIALQFVPSRIGPLRSFAGFPAVGFGFAAVAMGVRIQESENIYTPLEMGLGLAVLTVVAAGVTFPWLWRLPAVIVAANGATIAIIADLTDANDATVALFAAVTLCTAGVGLIAASFVPRLGTWCVAHAVYGHVLVYLAVAQAVRFDDAFLVALSVAIVVHAAEGVLAPRGRAPAIEAVIGEQSTLGWVRSVPGVVALVGLIPWVVVGSGQLAWFAEESTRLGVALGALALAYAVAAMVIRSDIVVGTATGLALATSGTAIVIAAPDVETVVGPVWVASVVVAMIAVRWRTSWFSAGAWALAYAGIYLSLYVVWFTYEPDVAPLHHWIPLIVAIAMTVAASLGSVILRQRTVLLPWLMTAAGTSAVAMAVGFAALTIEGWGVVWAWGLAAAGAMLIAAVAYRAGWLAPIVLAYLVVAYGDLLADPIESDAVWWMPFVGVALAASFVLPGLRSWRLTEASPLTMLFAVGVAAYAVVDSIDRGASGATMAWAALALAAISVARSEDAWLHAGGVLFIGAGAIESSGWLTICLATVAVTETVLAELRRNHAYARVLPWAAAALWGATCVSGLWWLDLEPGAATAVAISLGMTLSLVGLVLAMVYPVPGWSRRWWMPIVALGQAGLVSAGGYGSATLALTTATMAWAIITATEAVLVGIPATVRRFLVGVWASTVLGGASVVLFMQAFEMPPAAVVYTLMAIGATLSGSALTAWLLGNDDSRFTLWVYPLAALGQAALVGSMVQARWSFTDSEFTLVWSGIVWIEAILIGVGATIRRLGAGVWVSSLFMASGTALAMIAMPVEPIEAVWTTATFAVVLLTVWMTAVVGTENDRIRLWELPMATIAQGAIVASGLLAASGLTLADAYLTWFALFAVDAIAFAIAGTVTRTRWMTFVTAALVPIIAGTAIGWRDLGAVQVWVWFTIMVAAGVGAWGASKLRERPELDSLLDLWVMPLDLLAPASAIIASGTAFALLPRRQATVFVALVVAMVGLHILANRSRLAANDLAAEPLAAVAFVTSAALVAGALVADDVWSPWILLAIAALGVGAAGLAGATSARVAAGWTIGAAGFTGVSVIGSAALFMPLSQESGWVLVVNGAAFAAYAVTAGRPLVLHAAAVTWLAATLILIDQQWTLEVHAAVLAVSAVLLAMIEVERLRRHREDLPFPEWLHVAEWVLMLAPLSLAARDMVTESMAYGLLLAGEGAVLLVWGILSQVRRRAVVGLGAITAAILMTVMIPLVRGIGSSLTGGWWLLIGGVAAVVFITAGSLIEKYRMRIGDRLHHFGEIIERWD